MRDFDIVEQPAIMENLTVRFTNEARSFIQRNKQESFLLIMSYVKVHTSLFTSPEFKGNDTILAWKISTEFSHASKLIKAILLVLSYLRSETSELYISNLSNDNLRRNNVATHDQCADI